MRSPESLWILLVLVPLAYVMFHNYKYGRRELGRFKGRGAVENLFDVFTIKWFFTSLFFLFFVLFAVLSLVGFRSSREQPEEVPAEVDVMFVVDLSRSMLAEDVRPSRLDRSKAIIRGIIDRVPHSRFGITVYKGGAYSLVPVTEDRSSVGSALELLSPYLFSSPGTNMEEGIRAGLNGFPMKENRRRVMILLSDGESHRGRPVEAASRAGEDGVIIHVLGMGTEEGGRIPLSDSEYLTDKNGKQVVSSLRESLLERMAESGKGAYVRVTDSQSLSSILDRIEIGAQDGKIRYRIEGKYKSLLLISLIFLLLSILVKVVPWRGSL